MYEEEHLITDLFSGVSRITENTTITTMLSGESLIQGEPTSLGSLAVATLKEEEAMTNLFW
jgi:hypothetical protein